jgi:hypothetical protein
VGIALPVGMAAVSLGRVELLSGIWMGMAAGRVVDGVEQYCVDWICADGEQRCCSDGRVACSYAACGSGSGCGAVYAFDGAGESGADGDVETERVGELCVREELGWAGSAAWIAGRFEGGFEQRGEAWGGDYAGVCRGAERDGGTWREPWGAGDASAGLAGGAIGKFWVWGGDAAGDVTIECGNVGVVICGGFGESGRRDVRE